MDQAPYQISTPLFGDFGDVHFPLKSPDFTDSFVPLDPARSRLVKLFASAINYELTPVWSKVVGNNPGSPLVNTKPVESTFELDPVTHLTKQVNTKMPMLCLHRTGEQTWGSHTLQVDKCDQDWNLHYILPNMEVAETRRFSDILRIIPEIVRRVIRNRGHISFENGALQFFADKGGLGSIAMTKAESGQARFAGQVESPVWLATTITIHTVEYARDTEEEFGLFEGVDWHIGVGDSTGIIPNMIEAYTDIELLSDDDV